MRRLIFLICAVVLLLDLADDGCLGKVKFVAPTRAAHYSISSSTITSGQVDSQVGLPPENSGNIPRFTEQLVALGVVYSIKKRDFRWLGSSGGLPL